MDDAELNPPGTFDVTIRLFAGSGGLLISPQLDAVREYQDDDELVAAFEAFLGLKRDELARWMEPG